MEIDPEDVKAGFDLVKGALDTIKGLKDLIPAKGAGKDDLQRQIDVAERELALGEAQLAQALGYKLCRVHFPPVPMLKDRVHPRFVEEIARCPKCGGEEPSPEYFRQKEQFDQAADAYNARLSNGSPWV